MISIIIPTYNSERYLEQCLESITGQTYRDLDSICVNDASTDKTAMILEQYANADPRITVINNPTNKGVSESRNIGLKAAQGEWVMFVDSDDWIAQDNCERALDTAIKHDADTVMWCYIREFGQKSLPKIILPTENIWEKDVCNLQRRMFGPYLEELRHPDQVDALGTIWGKLYNKNIIQDTPQSVFVDINIVGTAEDVLFNIDYLAKASKVVYLPQPWYHYRKDMQSLSNKHKANLAEKWDRLYDEMEDRIVRYRLGKDFKQALQNRIAMSILGLSIIAMRGNGSWKSKYNALNDILHRDRQKKALRQLQLQYFAPHWKLYYYAAKHKLTLPFMLMQKVINTLVNKQ